MKILGMDKLCKNICVLICSVGLSQYNYAYVHTLYYTCKLHMQCTCILCNYMIGILMDKNNLCFLKGCSYKCHIDIIASSWKFSWNKILMITSFQLSMN